MDVCSGKWPFKDDEFDFVYCSNLLEDVKDPIRVINEMNRVGKEGQIIVPTPYLECRKGVDTWPGKEKYAGFIHHRWLCFFEDSVLRFMQKTPIATVYDWTHGISLNEIQQKGFYNIKWGDTIQAEEIVYADWNHWYKVLSEFFKIKPEVEK